MSPPRWCHCVKHEGFLRSAAISKQRGGRTRLDLNCGGRLSSYSSDLLRRGAASLRTPPRRRWRDASRLLWPLGSLPRIGSQPTRKCRGALSSKRHKSRSWLLDKRCCGTGRAVNLNSRRRSGEANLSETSPGLTRELDLGLNVAPSPAAPTKRLGRRLAPQLCRPARCPAQRRQPRGPWESGWCERGQRGFRSSLPQGPEGQGDDGAGWPDCGT